MEDAFQACQRDVERLDKNLLPYEQRLHSMGSHDSTDVLDDDKDLAPIDTGKTLDPHSAGYADEVVKALKLYDPEARRLRNLSREREQELEALVRRYAHAFLLAGAPLRPLAGEAEGVEFEINTGDATPVYRPPDSQG
jgi:hypothetical protein